MGAGGKLDDAPPPGVKEELLSLDELEGAGEELEAELDEEDDDGEDEEDEEGVDDEDEDAPGLTTKV